MINNKTHYENEMIGITPVKKARGAERGPDGGGRGGGPQ